ncbi:MAG TPA: glycosyltransferase family 2 protein [Candidatus Dormibacteraeota bacterium]|nr:glycosyltransferase family 2 protein [Candidatus Dormibacteraeota bacterium]
MKLSVVIPVLNERNSLPATIAALRACRGSTESIVSEISPSKPAASKTIASKIAEIIVSDGGSTDGTADWVRAQPDLILVNSARGKGPQLNAGAARATGDVLLFLHADSTLSQAGLDAMHSALSNSGPSGPSFFAPKSSASQLLGSQNPGSQLARIAGGAFYLRFAESRPRSLGFVAWGINLRARLRGSATGDQGIFVRRDVFQSIGGAPDWPLFEDVELVRRIKQAGKFVVLKTPLTVSGRRYIEHGVFRTALLIYGLRCAYWLGVPPHRLKNWFRDARGKQKSAV